jgi:hypothetical protein
MYGIIYTGAYMEIWKDIKGYEKLYQINNYGIVRTCPREVKGKWGKYTRKRKVLSRVLDKSGRYRVSLRKDGKNRKFYIHRLVAEHFHDISKRKKVVKHINGIKTDNRHINLEWK